MTEGIQIVLDDKIVHELASLAEELNNREENTGARRLVSIFDCLLEEISFNAPELYSEYNQPGKTIMYLKELKLKNKN